MSATKEKLKRLTDAQPEDATTDEIIKELIFEQMIERGLDDIKNNNVIDNEEMAKRIRSFHH